MKGTLKNQYRTVDKNGQPIKMSVYLLDGSDAELNAYQEAQTEAGYPAKVDEATGKLLYFSPTPYGKTVTIKVSEFGKVYVEDAQMDQVESLLARASSNPVLASALATEIAKSMVASTGFGTVASAPASEAPAQPASEASAQPNLED